ncbi:MAG: hypothetical protein NZ480_07495 [Bdellovibrionaceae bacterium]|nr:hypothetical protein [Pseudobdellovibrionaceae bacterium]MDW8189854.1 hypothetical protein [Pseudobdellovibrionaceae bacterium]
MKWHYVLVTFVTLLLVTSLELYQRYQIYLLNTKLINLAALQKEKRQLELQKMELAYRQEEDLLKTSHLVSTETILSRIIVMPEAHPSSKDQAEAIGKR